MALSVSREPRDFILWFRPEVVETVSWGGDPAKPVQPGANGDRLTPRQSFAVWKQTVYGRATPWHDSDNDAAFDLRVSLLEVVLRRIDAAARERERAYQQERLLMAELDHRVKNTLANIQALVNQTSQSAPSLTDFVEGLEGRIRAMAKAHSLLADSRWEGVSVRSLVAEELAPYDRSGTIVALAGPDVALTPQAALALSLTHPRTHHQCREIRRAFHAAGLGYRAVAFRRRWRCSPDLDRSRWPHRAAAGAGGALDPR